MKFNTFKIIVVFAMVFLAGDLMAQCSMCKAIVESNVNAGGTVGGGINDGIMYLMGVPYLLIATAGYFIYQNYKKNSSDDTEKDVL